MFQLNWVHDHDMAGNTELSSAQPSRLLFDCLPVHVHREKVRTAVCTCAHVYTCTLSSIPFQSCSIGRYLPTLPPDSALLSVRPTFFFFLSVDGNGWNVINETQRQNHLKKKEKES